MSVLLLEDAREYIFPIFSVRTQGNGVYLESRVFLGTGFFITKRGDAITANHVIPLPKNIQEGHRLIAIITEGGKEKVCWITKAAKFESFDIALFHVNLKITKYLQLTLDRILAGTDVHLIGIPNHEVWASGKEMRVLKGHITFSGRYLELNFPVPAGMSGSPLFVGTRVAGYATGMVRTEDIEEAIEEVEEISDKKVVTRTEIRRIIYYGLVCPFSHLKAVHDPILEGKTLLEFVAGQNADPNE